jgi:transcriptional regulator with XRE-family HTH domain
MFSDMLHRDRERHGLTVDQAARRLGVTPAAYRALETGERWPGSGSPTSSTRFLAR